MEYTELSKSQYNALSFLNGFTYNIETHWNLVGQQNLPFVSKIWPPLKIMGGVEDNILKYKGITCGTLF